MGRVGLCLCAILLALFAFGKFTDYAALWGGWGGHPVFGRDLLGTHYVVTQAWAEGYVDIYEPEQFLQWQREKGLLAAFPAMYPPLAYFVHLPLRGLTPELWVGNYFLLNQLWAILTGLLLLATSFAARREAGRALLVGALGVPIILVCAPSIECLFAGQLNLILGLVMTAIALAHTLDKKVAVGALAALGASLKLFPVFFLLLLLRKGGGRGLASFAATLVLLVVPVVLYTRSLVPYTDFFRHLSGILTLALHDGNQSLTAALLSTLGDNRLLRLLALAASLALVVITWRAPKAQEPSHRVVEAAAVMLLCLLVPGQSWAHYGVYALLAWLLLLGSVDLPVFALVPALAAAVAVGLFGGMICTQGWRIQIAMAMMHLHPSTIAYLVLWLVCMVTLRTPARTTPESAE